MEPMGVVSCRGPTRPRRGPRGPRTASLVRCLHSKLTDGERPRHTTEIKVPTPKGKTAEDPGRSNLPIDVPRFAGDGRKATNSLSDLGGTPWGRSVFLGPVPHLKWLGFSKLTSPPSTSQRPCIQIDFAPNPMN